VNLVINKNKYMNNLYEFLKSQDSSTLFWYGVFILVLVGIIVSGIERIFKYYFNSKYPKDKQKTKEKMGTGGHGGGVSM